MSKGNEELKVKIDEWLKYAKHDLDSAEFLQKLGEETN